MEPNQLHLLFMKQFTANNYFLTCGPWTPAPVSTSLFPEPSISCMKMLHIKLMSPFFLTLPRLQTMKYNKLIKMYHVGVASYANLYKEVCCWRSRWTRRPWRTRWASSPLWTSRPWWPLYTYRATFSLQNNTPYSITFTVDTDS